jgi:hypothetical protein
MLKAPSPAKEPPMLASLACRPYSVALLLFAILFALPESASRVSAASDEGEVRVINTPNVRLTAVDDGVLRDLRRARLTPSFLQPKKRYAFVWNPGEAAQTFVVVAVSDDGWVGVVVSDSPQPEFVTVVDPRDIRWINVTRAFSIQEVY